MATKKDIQSQVEEILKKAEERGTTSNFFFLTTFKRYQVQMNILTKLEAQIAEEGTMVSKEYVKGRKNLYVNPAITEYNKTATATNNTVATLLKIIDSVPEENDGKSLFEELNELLK